MPQFGKTGVGVVYVAVHVIPAEDDQVGLEGVDPLHQRGHPVLGQKLPVVDIRQQRYTRTVKSSRDVRVGEGVLLDLDPVGLGVSVGQDGHDQREHDDECR